MAKPRRIVRGREGTMPQLGPVELILILVIFVIFFGAGKLGDLGGALGRGLQEFKKNASLNSPPDEEGRRDRSA